MVQGVNDSDLLASYEHDFKDCVTLLNDIISDVDPATKLSQNSFALENANKLLKQMEVEAMNFIADDKVRNRVSIVCLLLRRSILSESSMINLTVKCMQMAKYKSDFDKLRKSIRKIQRDADRKSLVGGTDSMVSHIIQVKNNIGTNKEMFLQDTGDDIEMSSKHERVLLHNRNKLEEAKQVGIECEEMARDIKFNLRSQTDKLENKTIKNLFGMQKDLGKSNRLVMMIKKARFKNKLILWGIVALLVISVIFILYMALAPDS